SVLNSRFRPFPRNRATAVVCFCSWTHFLRMAQDRLAMDKIVPLISSGTTGPLGILHLPRLWLKGLLGATGKLADGYKDIGPGYDHMVLQGLGIDPDKARAFIHEKKPTYLEFEEWVKNYPGAKLDKATIFRTNTAIAS